MRVITSIVMGLLLALPALGGKWNGKDAGCKSTNLALAEQFISESTVGCLLCSVGFKGLQAAFKTKTAKEVVALLADLICTLGKIQDAYVCKNIVNEYKDVVLYLLANEALEPKIGCGVIGFCEKPDFPIYNATFSTPKPEVRPYPKPAPQDVDKMYVAHFSDIHVDIYYTPGNNNDCGETLCCRPSNGPGTSEETRAGVWGDYNCDAPPALYESALQFMSSQYPDLHLFLNTGDLPAHYVWEITRDDAVNTADFLANAFKGYFPSSMYYAAVGNHESVPVNLFVPRDLTPQPAEFNMSWLYDALAAKWANWLPEDAVKQAQYAGYYSTIVPFTAQDEHPLRVISLNTNMGCNAENLWMLIPSEAAVDPDGMMKWVINELTEAEAKGEVVYMIEHLALDSGECHKYWDSWYKILDRFENTIVGHFAGHTHDDKYEVLYNSECRPIQSVYFPGSLTTQGRNPGFRVYEIDRKTKAVLDYKQYWANLTLANQGNGPVWEVEYVASEAYGVADLSPAEWMGLQQRMASDNSLLYSYVQRTNKLLEGICMTDDCLQGWLGSTYVYAPGTTSCL